MNEVRSQSAATTGTRLIEIARQLCESQHGVVSRRQLTGEGIPGSTVDSAVGRGELHSVFRGTYAVGRRSLDRDGLLTAASLSGGPPAVICRTSAAELWGLLRTAPPRGLRGGRGILESPEPNSIRIEVMRLRRAPARSCTQLVGGQLVRVVLVTRSTRSLPDSDVDEIRGIPVTSLERTLLDLAAILSPPRLKYAFIEADRLKLLEYQKLAWRLDAARGHRGLGNLRRLIGTRAPDALRARSVLETLFAGLCIENDIPVPLNNECIGGREFDFVWPDQRVVVEVDGFEFHRGREMFEHDSARLNELVSDGWFVLRFTWRMVTSEPGRVAAQVRRALLRSQGHS